jgi:beta-phosphoglucomutase-like phosphatase (HAD superfamily)
MMKEKESGEAITREKYDALLFDLDGGLTDTANLHAACWKKMFDAFLETHAKEKNIPFQPFDIGRDYTQYVDGKLRYEGVCSFLESRGIHLPYGDPDDPPGYESITSLGNLKDRMVKEALGAGGIEVYEGSVSFLRHMRRQGFKTAVVSASKNCRAVLMDLADVAGNAADGCHIASMGGTWLTVVYGYAGMRDYDGRLSFRPIPPARPLKARFPLTVRGQTIEVEITQESVTYSLREGEKFTLRHYDEAIELLPGRPISKSLKTVGQTDT